MFFLQNNLTLYFCLFKCIIEIICTIKNLPILARNSAKLSSLLLGAAGRVEAGAGGSAGGGRKSGSSTAVPRASSSVSTRIHSKPSLQLVIELF